MQNNDCVHKFGPWKKMKKVVVDCESMDEESRASIGIGYERKCELCNIRDTKFEPITKKGKTKSLELKMNRK